MKKKFVFFLALIPLCMSAQTVINFKLKNGTESTYQLSSVDKHTFSEGNLVTEFNDGTTSEQTMSDLRIIYFDDTSTGLFERKMSNKAIEMNIYPMPASNYVNIDYVAQKTGNLHVEIITMQGQIVKSQAMKKTAGNNQLSLSIEGLPNDIYLCRLTDESKQIISKIIKK